MAEYGYSNAKNGDALFRCRSRDFVLALLLGTVESKNAAKKPHKMEKSADFFGGFLLFNGYSLALL